MSKKKNSMNDPLPGLTYGNYRMIEEYQIGNIIGRALTLVESFGFNETREKAVKDILRQTLEKTMYEDTTIIERDEAIKVYEVARQRALGASIG